MFKLNRVICFVIFSLCGFVFATSHTVSKGETLYSISRTYGVSVAELCEANNISQSNPVIIEGQKLTIPNKKVISATQKYKVAKGDTFYGIARRYGITVDELLSLNKMNSSDTLQVGQTLTVPSSSNNSLPTETNIVSLEIEDPRKYSEKNVDSSLQWPVKNPEVVYVNGKVSGVQLSAQKNESVTAVRAGTVMFSGVYRGFGKVVFVESQTGHMYVYTGLSNISVQKSDYVVMGDVLGTVGVDAITGKPLLTFMVFQNGNPIDPAKAPRG
ncbi:MAG: M23 family metallopeptidase [Spirochaetaceae bacterium]|nr:M23 family metallopeptidase [Spirochaetaceae bacterium]